MAQSENHNLVIRDEARALIKNIDTNGKFLLSAFHGNDQSKQMFMYEVLRLINHKPEYLINNTFVEALTKCALVGLIPNGEEAAIIPYNTKLTLVPMVRGLTRIALRTNRVGSINGHVIYVPEAFKYVTNSTVGNFMEIDHVKNVMPKDWYSLGDSGKDINSMPYFGAMAMVHYLNGHVATLFMTKDEIDKRSTISKNKYPETMAIKTAIKRLLNAHTDLAQRLSPEDTASLVHRRQSDFNLSPEHQMAIALDSDNEMTGGDYSRAVVTKATAMQFPIDDRPLEVESPRAMTEAETEAMAAKAKAKTNAMAQQSLMGDF